MKNIYKSFAVFLIAVCPLSICFGQDFVRIGAAMDFKKKQVVQTFSFDLNRTEKIDEKAGKYLFVTNDNWYLLPAVDVNIGEKTTSSENNILAQIIIGNYKNLQRRQGSSRDYSVAFELNPTFNTDKDFNEKLTYLQLKGVGNMIDSKGPSNAGGYVKSGYVIAAGLFTNVGFRYSRSFDTTGYYQTAGIVTECKFQWFGKVDESDENEDPFYKWQIKFSGNYFGIVADEKLLYDKDFGGILKLSVEKNLFQKVIYISAGYKLGNDTPLYTDFNALELSLKYNFVSFKPKPSAVKPAP
jgi:hypothetical protein